MKRSEINAIMRSADNFIRSCGFALPPFAYWSPDDWRTKGQEVREIVENRLGWDITDFGQNDFAHFGLFLFTVRNGHPHNWQLGGKLYAEKLMIAEDGQVTPLHFHWQKIEDIINRGGGILTVQLYNSTPEDELDLTTPVMISTDGVARKLAAGDILRLAPGESISLPQRLYHRFWAEGKRVLIGEVSLVNDDARDNRFYESFGRFPQIEEDEPPLHLMVNDYEVYWK